MNPVVQPGIGLPRILSPNRRTTRPVKYPTGLPPS